MNNTQQELTVEQAIEWAKSHAKALANGADENLENRIQKIANRARKSVVRKKII